MTGLEEGDAVVAIDHAGILAPVCGSVVKVAGMYVWVRYSGQDYGYGPGRADFYYRDSLWRAGECRWRLHLARHCVWCEHDISGPGEAMPVFYTRQPGPDNWQCTSWFSCTVRQNKLDLACGMPPVPEKYRMPIAELEAAS